MSYIMIAGTITPQITSGTFNLLSLGYDKECRHRKLNREKNTALCGAGKERDQWGRPAFLMRVSLRNDRF
jgi:hypothetical protein